MSVDVPSSAVAAVGDSAPAAKGRKRSGWVTGFGYAGVLLGTLLVFLIPGMKAGAGQDVVILATMLTLMLGAALVIVGLVWDVIRG